MAIASRPCSFRPVVATDPVLAPVRMHPRGRFPWLVSLRLVSLLAAVSVSTGCATGTGAAKRPPCPETDKTVAVEKVEIFRQAETRRAEELTQEIQRLQADLHKAEAALVEAESGLAGTHTRADAVSSLAVARIQVERAAANAPWRADEMEGARAKLEEAERQLAEGRFGAALFFVYRALRVAESVLAETRLVKQSGNARVVHARRVNLRAGPSTEEPILAVLEVGTPILPQTRQGEWVLVQVSNGPAGWIHRSLIGGALSDTLDAPAARP